MLVGTISTIVAARNTQSKSWEDARIRDFNIKARLQWRLLDLYKLSFLVTTDNIKPARLRTGKTARDFL